jgi:hypothetical protein
MEAECDVVYTLLTISNRSRTADAIDSQHVPTNVELPSAYHVGTNSQRIYCIRGMMTKIGSVTWRRLYVLTSWLCLFSSALGDQPWKVWSVLEGAHRS